MTIAGERCGLGGICKCAKIGTIAKRKRVDWAQDYLLKVLQIQDEIALTQWRLRVDKTGGAAAAVQVVR